MARDIEVAGISIFAKTAPCAHACRYCLMGKKKVSRLAVSRFVDLVDRFIDWRASNNPTFEIWQGVNYSAHIGTDDHAMLLGLHERLNWGRYSRRVHLGGLPIWSDEQLVEWLSVRMEQGIETVHASLAGHSETHDYWNKRKGDFDYLLKVMSIANRIGLGLRQRLFIIKSTIPLLEETIERLDAAGAPFERYFLTFFYRGTAIEHAHERIVSADLDLLPASVRQHPSWKDEVWRSEREWIGDLRRQGDQPDRVMLNLELTDKNIDEIEQLSCEELIERLTEKAARAYGAIPLRSRLMEGWSDPSSEFIYPYTADIERVWLDRYLAENPVQFDRHVTHLATTH